MAQTKCEICQSTIDVTEAGVNHQCSSPLIPNSISKDTIKRFKKWIERDPDVTTLECHWALLGWNACEESMKGER